VAAKVRWIETSIYYWFGKLRVGADRFSLTRRL